MIPPAASLESGANRIHIHLAEADLHHNCAGERETCSLHAVPEPRSSVYKTVVVLLRPAALPAWPLAMAGPGETGIWQRPARRAGAIRAPRSGVSALVALRPLANGPVAAGSWRHA